MGVPLENRQYFTLFTLTPSGGGFRSTLSEFDVFIIAASSALQSLHVVYFILNNLTLSFLSFNKHFYEILYVLRCPLLLLFFYFHLLLSILCIGLLILSSIIIIK